MKSLGYSLDYKIPILCLAIYLSPMCINHLLFFVLCLSSLSFPFYSFLIIIIVWEFDSSSLTYLHHLYLVFAWIHFACLLDPFYGFCSHYEVTEQAIQRRTALLILARGSVERSNTCHYPLKGHRQGKRVKVEGSSLSCLRYSPHWFAGKRPRELD